MAAGIIIPVEAGDKNTRTEGSRMYAIIVCIFASLAGLFFGYDQGVTGGVLVMDGFIDDFCVGFSGNTVEECHRSSTKLPGNWRTFTTLYNVMYYLGCAIGAALGGWIADKYGRRATIFNAGVWFCVGTIWICANPANQHTLIIFGRIVQGVGVGNSSFSVPIYGAEMAPKELRGLLSGFMQMTVVTGILVANCVNIGIKNYRHGWRITNGVSIAPPVIVMIGIFCIPESPRWMYQHKGREAAETTLKKLRMTENVGEELDAIGEQLELEGSSSWLELWDPSLRRRALIAMALQVLQQATGINPVFSYGALIYKDVVGDGTMSLLILAIVNFVSTIPAMRWVDSFGRRTLLLIGAVGMCLGHLVAAISFVAGCNGNTDNAGCNDTAGYIMIVASCFFVFNFAISWGPVCWIYPAEIFPLNVRAKAVSLSTMANWGMGAVMVAVVKLFPTLNIDGVFFLFFGTCTLCGIFVWFFCPETKGILLEDIEALFHGRATRKGVSPKYVEASTPNANVA